MQLAKGGGTAGTLRGNRCAASVLVFMPKSYRQFPSISFSNILYLNNKLEYLRVQMTTQWEAGAAAFSFSYSMTETPLTTIKLKGITLACVYVVLLCCTDIKAMKNQILKSNSTDLSEFLHN